MKLDPFKYFSQLRALCVVCAGLQHRGDSLGRVRARHGSGRGLWEPLATVQWRSGAGRAELKDGYRIYASPEQRRRWRTRHSVAGLGISGISHRARGAAVGHAFDGIPADGGSAWRGTGVASGGK